MGERGRGRRPRWRSLVAVVVLLAVGACSSGHPGSAAPPPRVAPSHGARGTAGPSPPALRPSPRRQLVRWTGPVEHLFFHTLVIHPDWPFGTARRARGSATTSSRSASSAGSSTSSYANGWTLVDIHRAVAGRVRSRRGASRSCCRRTTSTTTQRARPRGWVGGWCSTGGGGEGRGAGRARRHAGHRRRPRPDRRRVRGRPPRLLGGGRARECIALTGYEGLFGERVNQLDDPDTRARSHGPRPRRPPEGHAGGPSPATATATSTSTRLIGYGPADTEKWKALAEPLLGPTDVYIYPFGARHRRGRPRSTCCATSAITIQCDIDEGPRLGRADGLVVMSRRHIDGLALLQQNARRCGPSSTPGR